MVRDPYANRDIAKVEDVLSALNDPDCRHIIHELEEAMTAKQISNRCDIPLSTTYRKLDRMSNATLIEELTEIRKDGRHTTRYRLAFNELLFVLVADRTLQLTVTRPTQTADERLSSLWSEIRKEV